MNDEPGSKLTFITGIKHPEVELEVIKGKGQVAEILKVNLAEAIDLKGMKAQGNRLSQHEIKKVQLILSDEPEEEVSIQEVEPPVVLAEQDGPVQHMASEKSSLAIDISDDLNDEKEQLIVASKPTDGIVPNEETKPVVNAPEKISKPKKIDFEITNPDDIEIDEKGQLGLF
jgi:topoisomerase-4 subunit A